MAGPAEKLMTVDEFLRWDDGTDTRYELIDGQIVAMAPPSGPHRTIVANATRLLGNRLQARSPCRAEVEAGIRVSDLTRWQNWHGVTIWAAASSIATCSMARSRSTSCT